MNRFENSKAAGSNLSIGIFCNWKNIDKRGTGPMSLFQRNLWPGLSAGWWLTRSFENSKAGGSNSSIRQILITGELGLSQWNMDLK